MTKTLIEAYTNAVTAIDNSVATDRTFRRDLWCEARAAWLNLKNAAETDTSVKTLLSKHSILGSISDYTVESFHVINGTYRYPKFTAMFGKSWKTNNERLFTEACARVNALREYEDEKDEYMHR